MPTTWSASPEPVRSKADFVRRYAAGEFGNRSPTYQTWPELNSQGSSWRRYHLRCRIAGGPTHYNLDYFQAVKLWRACHNPGDWYCSEMAPHEFGTIQGEVHQTTNHLDLTYASAELPMREALAKGSRFAQGITATAILKSYMDGASWDWLNYLLGAYPGHVVEFSCFDCCWGTVPHHNTVIWEVRNY